MFQPRHLSAPKSTDAFRDFGFLLKDVSRLYSRNFERHSADLGLSLAQCKVLGYLQRYEGTSQARLAYLTDTDPMTLGRLLDRMAGDGLIERRSDPRDGRAHNLYLTPDAGSVLDEIWRLSDCARAESLSGLTAPDRSLLMKLLRRIQSNLDALMPGQADNEPTAANPLSKGRRPRATASHP